MKREQPAKETKEELPEMYRINQAMWMVWKPSTEYRNMEEVISSLL